MNTIVYASTGDAPAGCRFVAYLFEGSNPLPIRFFASTAAAAEERAATWLREESGRQARLHGSRMANLARAMKKRARATAE